MKTILNVALLSMACLASVPAHADGTPNDKLQIQGVWAVSDGETNGRSLKTVLHEKGLGAMKIKFSNDVMTMTGPGVLSHTYQFVLKPKGQPKVITLVTVETHGKAPEGSVIHGIYEIKGDTLKLCLPADSSGDRPEKFEAPNGSRLSLLVLSRQTDGDDEPAGPSDR